MQFDHPAGAGSDARGLDEYAPRPAFGQRRGQFEVRSQRQVAFGQREVTVELDADDRGELGLAVADITLGLRRRDAWDWLRFGSGGARREFHGENRCARPECPQGNPKQLHDTGL